MLPLPPGRPGGRKRAICSACGSSTAPGVLDQRVRAHRGSSPAAPSTPPSTGCPAPPDDLDRRRSTAGWIVCSIASPVAPAVMRGVGSTRAPATARRNSAVCRASAARCLRRGTHWRRAPPAGGHGGSAEAPAPAGDRHPEGSSRRATRSQYSGICVPHVDDGGRTSGPARPSGSGGSGTGAANCRGRVHAHVSAVPPCASAATASRRSAPARPGPVAPASPGWAASGRDDRNPMPLLHGLPSASRHECSRGRNRF